MIPVDLKNCIGFGVAGNFAGHLAQAGEAADFVNVRTAGENAPKGMFPFYLPNTPDHALGTFPVSSGQLVLPPDGGNVQIEPEVAILCELGYSGGQVVSVTPRFFTAYNDCSIRRPGARKISEKKNWGPSTKGVGNGWIAIDTFARGGVMDGYRIACYLRRNGTLHTYGIDSPVLGYSYFYGILLDWMREKLNTQQDDGPLEHLSGLLRIASHPSHAIVSVGATKYTPFGETHFLEPGDESIVAVYDGRKHDPASLERLLNGSGGSGDGLSVLRQAVVAAR